MSLLTTLRYLWEGTPTPDPELEAWVLGTRYAPCAEWAPEMLRDVQSRLWLMYRTSFPLIPRHPEGPSPIQLSVLIRGSAIDMHGFVSDIGWGCMIRTGQCLVANGLLHLELGREWRQGDGRELEIVRKFADTPRAPLSIHNFVAQGIPRGKLPGQWFGPATVAQCIKKLCSDISVYVSEGMDVYMDQLLAQQWPIMVLCPVRLGISEINPVYAEGIKACLSSTSSIGIAGGRTSASHYFYGFQGDTMFYHDPHIPRPALDPESPDLESTHSDRMRAMPLSEMDPSMLVGFLLKDRDDFEQWRSEMEAVPSRSRIIVLASQRPHEPPSDDEVDGYVLCDDMDADEALVDESMDHIEHERGESPEPVRSRRSSRHSSDEVLVSTPQVADESSVII